MMNTVARRLLMCFYLLLPILAVGCVKPAAPPPPPPPSPAVTARVAAARKIFLSNAGSDALFMADITGGTNRSYDELDASLKQWRYFQLVDSPIQADLIFEIRSTEASNQQWVMNTSTYGVGAGHNETTYSPPIFTLSVLDPSTREVLYQIVSPAGGSGMKIPKSTVAFTQSINTLTDKLKALVAVPAATQNH